MHNTVHSSLFATGTRSFLRPGRRIHPDINPLYQFLGQIHIIVRQKDDLTQELRIFGYLDNPFDQVLSGFIGRMGFPGKDKLHRMFGVIDDFIQAFEVTEQQVSPLVGSETPGKTYGQNIVPQSFTDLNHLPGSEIRSSHLVFQQFFYMIDQALTQFGTHLIYDSIGNGIDLFETFLIVMMILKIFTEQRFFYFLPFGSRPSRIMHPVGHITDVQLLGHISRPHAFENLFTHFAVQPANPIHFLSQISRKEAHREFLIRIGDIDFS